MKIAVIPARGGSKRIPRKNAKPFFGIPMIARTVSTALESGLFERVVVSTDDAEIAEIARTAGAQTPFVRPQELADDITPTVPVIAHAVEACNQLGWAVSAACCVYPCVPLLDMGDMANALEMMLANKADFVFPVTEYAHPIQRAMRRLPSGMMGLYNPQFEMTRTQDLEKSFHDAGQFYWGTAAAWLANKKVHSAGLGMPIPHWRVVDIDSEDDWQRAELLFKALKGRL
jgi:pseudaminic acid cytidylyltransferase